MSEVQQSKTAFLAQATVALTKAVTSIQATYGNKITLLQKPKAFSEKMVYTLGEHNLFFPNVIMFEIVFNFELKEPVAECKRIDIAYTMPNVRTGSEQSVQTFIITRIRELGWTKSVYMNGHESEKELAHLQQVLQHA